ncbi:hypothetical protein OCU04_006302 [Sclerotinia nivalis]|uniref:Uncharacterized protein n=1 Tax=Sclerotinia nivalis TaxID=352851 RepID=A0A9X0DL32_9HELO|nr:hypothetical protein OCU04_006302 [Sclerotinia nivalis]
MASTVILFDEFDIDLSTNVREFVLSFPKDSAALACFRARKRTAATSCLKLQIFGIVLLQFLFQLYLHIFVNLMYQTTNRALGASIAA